MTSGDSPAWLVARSALDYRDTVAALTGAMPDAITYADDPAARQHLAEHVTTELARLGYALVPLTVAAENVDDKLRDEAASSWFGREDA